MTNVELWLNPDIFFYGIIYAHPKLTIPYLKKVITYARSKGMEGGYPDLSWAVWRHMAVNKMLMDEDLSWTYFQVFFILKNKTVKEHLKFAELQQQLSESQHSLAYKKQMKVPTLEFVLFLFLQQVNKISLRKSLLGEEWPGSSPRLTDSPGHSNRSDITSACDERKHIQFILSHFCKIVELLTNGSKTIINISSEIIQAFGTVIHGRISEKTIILPLFDVSVKHVVQMYSGYMRLPNTFSLQTFEKWLNKSLTENPFGYASCLTFGTKLNWTTPMLKSGFQRSKAKILTNALNSPSDHKVIIFTQCSNQTIARQATFLNGAYVKIYQCHSSYIYLLSPLKCVSIEKCSNTCIILGPVATCIKLVNCQHLTLIAPCRSVIISSSSDIKLYVTTPSQPIILYEQSVTGSEKTITLAPYNTFYPEVETHLAMIGLVVSPNTDQWNNPVIIGHRHIDSSNSKSLSSRLTNATKSICEENLFTILKPKDFYTFAIPFKTKSVQEKNSEKYCISKEVPGGLPQEYAKAVKSKQREVERWRLAVKKSDLTKEDRKQFQTLVEEKFKEWVSETNNQKQLDDLGHKSKRI